jgi:hypothetical protein
VSAPKSGTVHEDAQSLDGSIEMKWIARVSPGSAPSTKNGPVCGLTNGNSITRETQSSGPRTLPPNASSVQSSRMSPGFTARTGGTPPNVHANSEGSGR